MKQSARDKQLREITEMRKKSKDKLKQYLENAETYCKNRELLDNILSYAPNFDGVNLDNL